MPPATEHLRISPRSAVAAVALLGVALALLRLLAASQRVIGWVLAAAAVAGLLQPMVSRLSQRLPRGAAVAVVAVASLAFVGVLTYGVVQSLVRETHHLQEDVPRAAARLEHGGRFSGAARDFHLAARAKRFVDDVPERLRGGTPADALRAAATRGVAFLATAVLSLFFLLHGPRIAGAAARQVTDDDRRQRLEGVASRAYARAFGYARGTIAMATLLGAVTYVMAVAAGVRAPAPLAVWAALWDTVPLLGVVVGSAPLIVLAGVGAPERAIGLAAFFLAYQALEAAALQPMVERRTLRVGPFLTVAAGVIGLELYGLGGVLLVPLAVTFGLAVADEVSG